MGRTRRDCPVFGCTSMNLARLANHLDQIHNMDTQERAKWLKWSKLGLRLPLQTEESVVNSNEQTLMQETLTKLLQRQEEMERNFNKYLREEQGTSTTAKRKKKTSKQHINNRQSIDKIKDRKIAKKWLTF